MPDDLKILVGTELDISGIQEKLKEIGKTRKITLGVNVGNANRSIKSIETNIENLRKIAAKPLDLTVSSGNISGALASISNAVNKAIGAISQLNSSISNIGSQSGSAGINVVVSQLNELSSVVKELNAKDFNISNIFNYDGKSATNKGLSTYREQARELVELLNQLQNTVTGIDSKSMGKIYTQVKDSFVAIDEMNLKELSKRTGNSSINGLQSVIDEMQRYKSAMEQIIVVAQKYNSEISMPDMSAYNNAAERVRNFEEQLKKQEDQFINAATGQSTQSTSNVSSQAAQQVELNVESIQKATQELNGLFDQLKTKIDETFNFSSAVSGVSQLKQALEELGATLTELNKNSVAVIEQAKQAVNSNSNTNANTSGGNTSNVPTSINGVDVYGNTKYYNELIEAVKQMGDAFADTENKLSVSSVKIKEDINGTQSAIVNFKNTLGELVSVSFKNEGNGWERIGDSYKKSFEDVTKILSDAEAKLNQISKGAFSGTNALTGDFAKEAKKQIDEVASNFSKIKDAAQNSMNGAADISKDEINRMLDELKFNLDQLAKIEYPSDRLAAQNVDVKKAFGTDALVEMEERLKSLGGSTTEYYNRVQDLKTLLSSIGQIDSDPSAWANFRNELHLLEDDIKKFESSAQGMGQKLAFDIDTNQLQQITEVVDRLNNIDQQYSGAGVEKLQQNLQQLAADYLQVQKELQNPNLSANEYDALAKKIQELDAQLKQAANAAKIFNSGINNDDALIKYQQNAEAVRMKFEQLQNTYAKLAQSNPQIASKFEEIRQKLEGMDPKNINEVSRSVNNLAKECGIASHQSAGLRGALQDAFGGLGSYISRFASSYFIITKAIQGIKSMVNAVKEVDSSLVELQKVTGLTGTALDQFTDKAYKLGETLGRTGSDVINAAATFSRAGYDLQEATELAQSALVMTNVGVDISSTEAAASDMISILKAFDVQAEDSMGVIDKLYNVANKEPLDFGNITHMLVTAGGTLAQTGTSLEETMGLLTGAFATMRDPAVANG